MITTYLTADYVDGASWIENTDRGIRPHRLSADILARYADPQLSMMDAQPSGVRVAVRTSAVDIALDVHATRVTYRGMTRARGAVDVVVDGALHRSHPLSGGDVVEVDPSTGSRTFLPGSSELVSVTDLPPGEKTVELWLPHNEQVDVVAVHSDSPLLPVPPQGPTWLHHGSSISHGSNATSPTRIWPAVAARRAGYRLRNLGFGGSALVDPFMARFMRDTPADVISVALGINVVNFDAMRLRSFVPAVHGFLDTIRDGHPTTPLILLSPIHCAIHENTPGPGAIDPTADAVRFVATGTEGDTALGRLTLRVVRDAMAEVVAGRSDDPSLSYVDGRTLYDEKDAAEHPLPDALHPDTETHALIGQRFAEVLRAAV